MPDSYEFLKQQVEELKARQREDDLNELIRQLADACARADRWERRAKAFQEGYKNKSFEMFALEIQLLDLRAHGVDKVTARNNESLKDKLLAACAERNELREEVERLRAELAAIKPVR